MDVGETENMSRKGVLIRLAGCSAIAARLHQGDFIEADLELPSQRQDCPRALHCRGAAVWWEVRGSDLLVGLEVAYMRFRNMPGRPVNDGTHETLVM